MACFSIIYGFMASLLHLEGYSKEIFAVIFGFWIRSRKPVTVPYSVIKKITGATDPTISACVKSLKDRGLISADQKPGTRTKYAIVLTEDIWKAYLQDSGVKISEELNSFKNSPKVLPQATKIAIEHKKSKNIQRKDSAPASNLVVSSASSVVARVKTVEIKQTS